MADYIIGIDGGGTKTDFLLADKELNEVGRRFASRSNPNDIGIESVVELLCENTKALISENNVDFCDVKAVFAGIAGLTIADFQEKVVKALSEFLPNAVIEASHDGINVLYGAFPESDGVSIICGTGSSCFVKKGDEIHRIGGYGSFDLLGNGYEIGRMGIAHALKTIDGRAELSPLSQLLKKRMAEDDLLVALDSFLLMSKNELASFAVTVFEAAELGDSAAKAIIRSNIQYIAELINSAGRFFEVSYRVSIAGSVGRNPLSLSILREMISDRAKIVLVDAPPSFGAAAKAKTLIV